MADVFGIASSVVSLAKSISKLLNEAKHNKVKCRYVSEHVQSLAEVVDRIRNNPEPLLEGPLQHVKEVMDETFQFVEAYSKMGRVQRFLKAAALKEDFADLVKKLDSGLEGT